MANPLDAFKGLKRWQQGAIVAGGVAVAGGYVLYERKQKSAAAAAATPAAASSALTGASVAGTVTDPTTGTAYPADSVDPLTQMTYAQEIAEFGSVSAADEEATEDGGAASEEGLTETEYDEETGQSPGGSGGNTQWVADAEAAGSELGYSSADIGQALSAYLANGQLGTTTDGVSEKTIINDIISEIGPPPTGTFPIIGGGGGAPAGSTVTVPDAVGRTDLRTAEAVITAAGLVPHAAGDSGAGNKGKVTSQDPAAGSTASKGSSVTLTYTVSGSTTPPATGDVTVPSAVGRKDLSTAEAVIRKAGLAAKAAGDSAVGNKGTVTSQDPAAGAKVAKGSTVTLTYTTAPSKTNPHV